MLAEVPLLVGAIYLAMGMLFAVPFVLVGARRIDPHAAGGSWGFQLIIIPGVILLWPWLARRWWQLRSA